MPTVRSRLGHRRLSIIDLTDAARQPMETRDGRYVITYNGEIYNFQGAEGGTVGARASVQVAPATARCCCTLSQSGGSMRCSKLNGMFAFAIWDTAERTLTLARDRFGVKPLYYVQVNDAFLFASEIKAFRRVPRLYCAARCRGPCRISHVPEFLHRPNFI